MFGKTDFFLFFARKSIKRKTIKQINDEKENEVAVAQMEAAHFGVQSSVLGLNAQLQQVANRFTEVQSVISLYQALGGGH